MKRDEWKRERTCTRKRAFRSRFYAEAFAARELGKPDMKAYRCPYCQDWHLTNGNGK